MPCLYSVRAAEMRFTGVFVLLALAYGTAIGQPTYDAGELDEFHRWRDGRQLLEEMAAAFQRLLRQQDRQGERMDRLEQTMTEGQRRLEMQVSQVQQQQQQQQQQLGDQVDRMSRYASLQIDYHHRHQLMLDNVTAKLDALSEDVKTIREDADSNRQLVAEIRNLTARLVDGQQSAYDDDRKRRNNSAEQLEMIAGSMAVMRQDLGRISDVIAETNTTKMQNTVVGALTDIVSNATKKLAEIDDKFEAFNGVFLRNAQFERGQFESMNELLHQIRSQQQQQQARDDKLLEITNSTAHSQLPLLEHYGQIQNSIGENISRVLVTLTNISRSQDRQEAVVGTVEERTVVIHQGQSRLEQFIARELHQQVQLMNVAILQSGELVANNLSLQLMDVGESCIRASSGSGEAIQTQTQLLSDLIRLHEEAVVSNVSKLLEAAGDERDRRTDDVRNEVIAALENVTASLRAMRDKDQNVSDESLNRDLNFQRKIVGIVINVTKSQQQLFSEVGDELRRAANDSLIPAESHEQLVDRVRNRSDAIQIQLTRVEEEVDRYCERELLSSHYFTSSSSSSNMTATSAAAESTCASATGSVNEMLVQEFHEQCHTARENVRLLEALNENWMTFAEQSLLQYSDSVHSITTTQTVAIPDTVSPTCHPSST